MTAGTLIISGLAFRLYLHSLVLSPEPQLQQLADLPSPEPLTGGKTDQTVTAIWASDSSAVLLQYTIRDFSDARTEFNENSFFEVGLHLGLQQQPPPALHSGGKQLLVTLTDSK